MDDGIGMEALVGRWVHARQEDTAEGKMYRRSAGAPAPVGRGAPSNEELSLMPDNSLAVRAPGAADREQTSEGTWRLEDGGRLVLSFTGHPPETLTMQILSVGPDRLLVKK